MADNACVYVADPSLLTSKLFDSIGAIKGYEGLSEGEQAVGIRFDLGLADVQMNFMPVEQIREHLRGLAGYVQSICPDQDRLVYVLSRVSSICFVMGCVIEPRFDDQGVVQDFLLEFNNRLNGLLFVYDSVVDYDGEPLVGPLSDDSPGLKAGGSNDPAMLSRTLRVRQLSHRQR
jgi:hypothetical protein